MKKDKRIELILEQIIRFTAFDFRSMENISNKGDEIDALIVGLNTLGEELEAQRKEMLSDKKRLFQLMEILIQASNLDFSKKMEVSEKGDEIDAIAVGLNTMSEELESYIQLIRETENRFQTIIGNAPDAVIVIDETSMIIEWNQRAENIFGWKREVVIGKYLPEIIIPKKFRGAHIKGLKHFLQTGEGPILNKPIELPALRKDNSEFTAGLSISPFDYKGEKYFIGFVSDISPRKKAETKLKESEESLKERTAQLELTNKELDSFTYSVSHDLRTPLRAIIGYSNILVEDYNDKLDDEGRRTLNIIMKNTERMGQLIDDLLAFSRIGKQNLIKANVDMTVLVNTIASELHIQQSDKIELNIQPLPSAKCDSSMMKQVMTNLIGNALKYSGKKEKSIIEIGSYSDSNNTVYYVKDNGAGFDMNFYDKLFGVFQRLHSGKEFEGTGVGLALVQRIISKHEGKVWAEAKINEGATFYFSLPGN